MPGRKRTRRSTRARTRSRAPGGSAPSSARRRYRKARLHMAPELAGQLWAWLGDGPARAVREDPYLAPAFEALARGDWRALTQGGALRFTPGARSTFNRAVRRVFRTGYVKVALDFRLETARRLLRETDEPVAAVAYAVGYPNPTVFRHAFARRFGTPPASARGAEGRSHRTR